MLDFGIAKAVSMTRSVTFNQFGSVPYSSPERLQTGDMDARSDVWSMAVVLFEMLTGKAYFQAEAPSKLEWMIRNYRSPQPSIAEIQPGLREILSRGLDPDLNRRFPSAAAFESALHEWNRYAVAGPVPADADPQATRRTAFPNPDEHTRRNAAASPRATPPPIQKPAVRPPSPAFRLPKTLARVFAGTLIAVFLATVFSIVYSVRMLGNAKKLATQIDSGQLTLDQGSKAYEAMADKSWFSLPLFPARNSLRDAYVADADRVMADYKDESESTPVNIHDWQRAAGDLKNAIALAPDDKSIRGKSKIAQGYLNLLHRPRPYLQTAREDFDDALNLLPRNSPYPHLGLAQFYMLDGDLEKAESELSQTKNNGVVPGRGRQKDLADAYRRRGEKYLYTARKAHDIGRMQDLLQRGDADLAHAQSLYSQISFLNADDIVESVSAERAQVAKTLADSKVAMQGPPRENP